MARFWSRHSSHSTHLSILTDAFLLKCILFHYCNNLPPMQSAQQLMPGKSNANLRGHNSVKYLTNVRLAITRQQEQHLKSLHTKHITKKKEDTFGCKIDERAIPDRFEWFLQSSSILSIAVQLQCIELIHSITISSILCCASVTGFAVFGIKFML